MARHITKYTGVIYRDSITNEKVDKTYYIRYKDENNKTKELKIGKCSEGYRENYCNQKRNEIITKMRLGEEPPLALKNKQSKKILLIDIKNKYFETRREGKSKQSDLASFGKHLEPFFKDKNLEFISKEDIKKLQKILKEKKTIQKKPLSTKTIHNILTILKSITSFALKEEILKNDYRKYIEMDSIRNQRDRFLTLEEIKELYKNLENDKSAQAGVFGRLAVFYSEDLMK